MSEGKLKTPDWILKGEKAPPKKKSEKTYKVKICPKCGSAEVSVVLGGEEGKGSRGWQCKSCGWKGKDADEKEMSEDEFMTHLDKMEGK